MARRSKTRRVLKWGGPVVCVLLAVMLVLSAGYRVEWSRTDALVGLSEGVVWCLLERGRQPSREADGARMRVFAPYGWNVHRSDVSQWRSRLRSLDWLPRVRRLSVSTIVLTEITVPIWMPLVGIGVATAFLWWRDRRYPPGHCQKCGYNLTGNVSGRCPECGHPI